MIPKNIREKAEEYAKNPPPQKPYIDPRQIKSGIWVALIFTVFFIVNVNVWRSGSFDDFGKWGEWLAIAGMVMFGSFAAFSWTSYFLGWSAYEEERIGLKILKWAILGPLIFIVGAFLIFFVGRWLFEIPAWAAVIIILLLLILFKKNR